MSWRMIVLSLLLTGCGPLGGCPDRGPLNLFASGGFTSPGGLPYEPACYDCGMVFEPHDGVTDFSMDLDLAGEVVTISYTRNGTAVEESWRITDRDDR